MKTIRQTFPWMQTIACGILCVMGALVKADAPEGRAELRVGNLKANKVLILGNSVALHGPAPQIGWNGNWGMAASSRDKDFSHVLVGRIGKAAQGTPELLVQNFADFERQQTDFDFESGLREAIAFDADIVIVAVGANAPAFENDAAKDRYRKAFDHLLALLHREKKNVLIVRGEFWHDAAKEQVMRSACESAGGHYVPLIDLDKDPANLGSADQNFEHAGVAGHPGDQGMRLIAEALWNAIEKLSK